MKRRIMGSSVTQWFLYEFAWSLSAFNWWPGQVKLPTQARVESDVTRQSISTSGTFKVHV